MFRSSQLALLRVLLIPAAGSVCFGVYGFRLHVWWGDYFLAGGIFCTTLLILLIEKQGW